MLEIFGNRTINQNPEYLDFSFDKELNKKFREEESIGPIEKNALNRSGS